MDATQRFEENAEKMTSRREDIIAKWLVSNR